MFIKIEVLLLALIPTIDLIDLNMLLKQLIFRYDEK
jgi:hypothetical protein